MINLCSKDHILALIRAGRMSIAGVEPPQEAFLDDLRVGVRLRDDLYKIEGPIDISDPDSSRVVVMRTSDAVLQPGSLYLGISREQFRLPSNVFGFLNTRSKYARWGFELAKSSTFVIPGFGTPDPSPIVFEIVVPHEVTGLRTNEAYGFLLLFETDFQVSTQNSDYGDRFPLGLLSKM